MTTEIRAAIDIQGYSDVYEACASLVESSEHRPLACVALLNATIAIALGVIGREKLEHALLGAIGNLEMAEAAARGRLA